ncbi:hypothetical protein [Streptomyces sp. NPDC087859]
MADAGCDLAKLIAAGVHEQELVHLAVLLRVLADLAAETGDDRGISG